MEFEQNRAALAELAALKEKQEAKVLELTAECGHWERKAGSLGRELSKAGGAGSLVQQMNSIAELREENAVLKSKLRVR
jgi:hypothetical protein